MKCLHETEIKNGIVECVKTGIPCPYSGVMFTDVAVGHSKTPPEPCFFATEIIRRYNDRFLQETRRMIQENPEIEIELSKR